MTEDKATDDLMEGEMSQSPGDRAEPKPLDPSDFEPEQPHDLEEQLAAAKDRVLRLQAEVQNQITRGGRLVAEERRYAAMPLLKDILPVLDNIDRAIEAAGKDGPSEGLLEGVRLVRQQLLDVLQRNKCAPIEADGLPFDPDLHEAILQQPSSDFPLGTVIMTTQSGYQLHDRVVRASQVIVSSGLPSDET